MFDKIILESCIFVFDTSALLSFYDFTEGNQNEIMDKVFKELQGRLRIPGHVEYEFLKNKNKVIKRPIKKYEELEKQLSDKFINSISQLKGYANTFIEQTKKNGMHPYINENSSKRLNTLLTDFEQSYKQIEEKIKQSFEKQKKGIASSIAKDILFHNYKEYFIIGQEYSFDEILKIVAEGEFRYRNYVSPGFKDDNKEGTQKYGDLIIWKQILSFAKDNNKPIILVSNDKKSDWCIVEDDDLLPSPDLLKEFRDYSEQEFYICSFDKFLYAIKKDLNIEIKNRLIEEAIVLSDQQRFVQERKGGCVYTINGKNIIMEISYTCKLRNDIILFTISDELSLNNWDSFTDQEKRNMLFCLLKKYLWLALGSNPYKAIIRFLDTKGEIRKLGDIIAEYYALTKYIIDECEFTITSLYEEKILKMKEETQKLLLR